MSYIYFIQAEQGGPIKIGYTASAPHKRLAGLQTSTPSRLKLLGAIVGTFDEEQNIHRQLSAWNTVGEWFEDAPEVVGFISKLRSEREAAPPRPSKLSTPTREWTPKYDHPLCIWLCRNRIRYRDFAKRLGVTQAALSNMFIDGRWVGKDLARKIYQETNGEVAPNDYLFWEPRSADEREAA